MEAPKVFIENRSQFDKDLVIEKRAKDTMRDKVLFATEKGPVQILFTRKGLVYRMEKVENEKVKEKEIKRTGMSHEEMEKEEHEIDIETDVVKMFWENANPDVEVMGMNPATGYFSYSTGSKRSFTANAYQKLLYKNLYPGIDAEYIFHPQQGIEYSFILHPGADPSLIKMKYSDVSTMHFDKHGNLHLATAFGDIVDHAPLTSYAGEKGDKINSRFTRSGKSISFQLENYDLGKEAIIDPWTVTPSLPNTNKVFCIKADSSNNVYVYGGDHPFKLQKYNSSGVLQWTYSTLWDTTNSWFGTLAVDKAGNSYITDGSLAGISKINTDGTLVWTNTSYSTLFYPQYEFWGLALNSTETQLVAGGTKLRAPSFDFFGIIYNLDLNNGNITDSIQVADQIFLSLPCPNEVRSICYAPNGNYYFLTLDTIGSINSSFGINFRARSGYRFGYNSPAYGFTPQGQSIICANTNFIYTLRGDSIDKRDINTGAVLQRSIVPGGAFITQIDSAIYPKNGGIALDDCGNVYAGSQTGVYKFDGNLNLLSSVTTPAAVYAVAVNNNGEVLAAGAGFATSTNFSACSPYLSPSVAVSVSHANTTCATVCNGSANAVVTYGTPPYSFMWSNNATSASITGLCPGTYSLTVTDSLGHSSITSTTIQLTPFVLTDSVINTVCGGNSGVAGITSLSGIPPYSFLWNTGATSSVIFGLTPGIYSVVITDSAGCILHDTLPIAGTGNANIAITTNQATICANDSAMICAPSGYSAYAWNTGGTTGCINTSLAGSYAVTVTDNNYCTAASLPLAISVLPLPVVSVILNGNVFSVSSADSLQAYQWYLNDTLVSGAVAPTYSASNAGYYSVGATGVNGCVGFSLPVHYSPCAANFVLFPDLTTPHNWWAINQATGAAPLTYVWNWGDGYTSTGAFPTHLYAAPGNYNICLSITDSNLCTDTYCDSSTYIYKTEDMISVNVVNQLPTDIKDDILLTGMYLFPNPAGNELNISIQGMQAERVRIYNVKGQLVMDVKQPQANRINVSLLATGVYMAEVQARGATGRSRWVKM